MRFDPEQANANLLPEEWYDAIILNAYEKTSKAGHPCMVVQVKVYGGTQPIIDRYFVMDSPSGIGGMRKLCHALGILDEFRSGNIEAELLTGRGVQTLIKIQKDATGQWDDKNVCVQFRPQNVQASGPVPGDPHVFDENDPAIKEADIPF